MDLKNYKIIEPPIIKRFDEMTNAEAKLRFDWFLNIIPERIEILKNTIKKDEPRTATKIDLTPESLIPLGEWFGKHVHIREMTKEEIKEEEKHISKKMPDFEVEKWILTDETISLCYDVGIYFANILQINIKNLKWVLDKTRKDSIDYNRPVLLGDNYLTVNPIQLIEGQAFMLADKPKDNVDFIGLYKIWVEELSVREKEMGNRWIQLRNRWKQLLKKGNRI